MGHLNFIQTVAALIAVFGIENIALCLIANRKHIIKELNGK